jgi:hypothetical protein
VQDIPIAVLIEPDTIEANGALFSARYALAVVPKEK